MEQERISLNACVAAYAVGVRLQQALILQDIAETNPTNTKREGVQLAVRRLSDAVDSLAKAEVVVVDTEATKKKIMTALRDWKRWLSTGIESKSDWSPLRPVLEMVRDMFRLIFQSGEFAVCNTQDEFDIQHPLLTWYQLGLSIVNGQFDEEKQVWSWDNRQYLNSLLSELGIDLRDVYFAVSPNSIANPVYPSNQAGWDNIDFALHELQQGRSARAFLSDPNAPIPCVRTDEETNAHNNQGVDTPASAPVSQPVPVSPEHQQPEAYYADNFRFVQWYGAEYRFTVNQACCVQVLWEQAENGIYALTQETITEKAFGNARRLRDVFKEEGKSTHPAWGKMIVRDPDRKGMYRLSRPVPRASPRTSAR